MNPAESITSKLVMQGVHIDLTEAMQNIIREKFSALLRHNESIIRINLRVQKDQTLGQEHLYRATAQIEIGGPDLVASAVGKEAYAVLDELVDKLDRLLERRQGRRKDRRNHPEEIELDAPIPKTE